MKISIKKDQSVNKIDLKNDKIRVVVSDRGRLVLFLGFEKNKRSVFNGLLLGHIDIDPGEDVWDTDDVGVFATWSTDSFNEAEEVESITIQFK